MSDVPQTQRASEVANREQSQPERSAQAVLRPAGDIFEHNEGITLLLDMPGVSKERLSIESDRNTLTVEGEVKIDMPKDTESLHADIRCTRYRRTFSLSGEQLDTDAVQASLKDGVLRIDIPKRAEMRPRRIEVQTD
jgi:HSP20 family molecular chaperone IbpA